MKKNLSNAVVVFFENTKMPDKADIRMRVFAYQLYQEIENGKILLKFSLAYSITSSTDRLFPLTEVLLNEKFFLES